MDKVYMVEGYFGSDEWTEKCFANQDDAQNYCNELWAERQSKRYPERTGGYALAKFFVEEYEVH